MSTERITIERVEAPSGAWAVLRTTTRWFGEYLSKSGDWVLVEEGALIPAECWHTTTEDGTHE